jgi:hypothetical protein
MIGQAAMIKQDPSTSLERPALRKGQIVNQDQIQEGDPLVVHGPRNSREKVIVIRGPYKCGGSLCIKLLFKNSQCEETINLADLSVVRYRNGRWNLDYWLGRY